MSPKTVQFLNIDNENWNLDDFTNEYPRLYRFVQIERLLDLFNHNRIFFSDPQKWNDPWEKKYLNAKFQKGEEEYSIPITDKLYSLCWTGTYSSEAYWNTYIKHNDGARFSVSPQKIIEFLNSLLKNNNKIHSIYIGKVKYDFINEIYNYIIEIKRKQEFVNSILNQELNKEQCKLFLFKRNAFQYENEVRIIILFKNSIKSSNPKPGFRSFKIQPNDLLDGNKIILDHRMELQTYRVFKKYISQKISNSTIVIQKSSLDSKQYLKTIIRL